MWLQNAVTDTHTHTNTHTHTHTQTYIQTNRQGSFPVSTYSVIKSLNIKRIK